MEVIEMKGLVEKAHGKVCQHDNNSVSYRKKDGKMFSMRICNPRDLKKKPYTTKELEIQTTFTEASKVASAWTAANRVFKSDGRTIDLSASTEDYRKMRTAYDAQDKIPTFQAYVRSQIVDGAVVVPDVAVSGGSSSGSSGSTTKYTVTLVANPAAGGSVSGAGQYTAGTTVTIKANALSGYKFSQWSDGNTSATRSVTVNSNMSLTANFVEDAGASTVPEGDDDEAEA